ncbi:hypothetical protein HZB05_00230 [Candidatus Wolfebacteria bacterium]|nr:hypothetical protein [Candidatus Wolfebacteria bacterium]
MAFESMQPIQPEKKPLPSQQETQPMVPYGETEIEFKPSGEVEITSRKSGEKEEHKLSEIEKSVYSQLPMESRTKIEERLKIYQNEISVYLPPAEVMRQVEKEREYLAQEEMKKITFH